MSDIEGLFFTLPYEAWNASEKDIARFWDKALKSDGCWEWTAGKNFNGYGEFSYKDRKVKAHRFSYELARGVIRHTIDHLCRNRGCVNPSHMEDVPIQTNTMRGTGLNAQAMRSGFCLRGHSLSGDNIKISSRGVRVCKLCRRICENARNAKKREVAKCKTI